MQGTSLVSQARTAAGTWYFSFNCYEYEKTPQQSTSCQRLVLSGFVIEVTKAKQGGIKFRGKDNEPRTKQSYLLKSVGRAELQNGENTPSTKVNQKEIK